MYPTEEILNDSQTRIIDVRTPGEFMGGAIADSKNIPLDQIMDHVEELRSAGGPIVLCCASGGRSAMACQMLAAKGLDQIYDGGGWMYLNGRLMEARHA